MLNFSPFALKKLISPIKKIAGDHVIEPVVWDDLRFPAINTQKNPVNSDPDYDYTNLGFTFTPTLDETSPINVIAQLTHKYKRGEDIHPHVHWVPSNTNTDTMVWRLSYRWYNGGEVPGAFTDIDTIVTPSGVAGQLQINGLGTLSKPDAIESSMLDIKISRIGDAAEDTFTGNALLKEFDIHVPIDKIGSIEEIPT